MAYCTRCTVHGHSLDSCRKSKELKAKKLNNEKVYTHGTEHRPMHKAAPRNVTVGDNKKVEVTIAGASSQGGDDLQWQKVIQKKSKHQADHGAFVPKDHPNEATPKEK